jgi:hypothetical protein
VLAHPSEGGIDRASADWVVRNDGSLADLMAQVDDLLEREGRP